METEVHYQSKLFYLNDNGPDVVYLSIHCPGHRARPLSQTEYQTEMVSVGTFSESYPCSGKLCYKYYFVNMYYMMIVFNFAIFFKTRAECQIWPIFFKTYDYM